MFKVSPHNFHVWPDILLGSWLGLCYIHGDATDYGFVSSVVRFQANFTGAHILKPYPAS